VKARQTKVERHRVGDVQNESFPFGATIAALVGMLGVRLALRKKAPSRGA